MWLTTVAWNILKHFSDIEQTLTMVIAVVAIHSWVTILNGCSQCVRMAVGVLCVWIRDWWPQRCWPCKGAYVGWILLSILWRADGSVQHGSTTQVLQQTSSVTALIFTTFKDLNATRMDGPVVASAVWSSSSLDEAIIDRYIVPNCIVPGDSRCFMVRKQLLNFSIKIT